jgi:flagellar biosynthesis component FlhA
MKTFAKYRVLTLLAGIATALLIVFSQLFYFQAATYSLKKAETEQKQKEKKKEASHEAYVSIPSHTISSVSHIQVIDGITFVLETLLEDQSEETTPAVPALVNTFFKTLFQFIIAPNAP